MSQFDDATYRRERMVSLVQVKGAEQPFRSMPMSTPISHDLLQPVRVLV